VQASPGQRSKLVVVHPERRAQRSLQRLVGATQCKVDVYDNIDAALKVIDASTIAVVDAAIAQARPALRELDAKAWIAVPGEGLAPAEAGVLDGLLASGWTHVVAHQMPILAEELLATIQKLMRDQVFGLEKYMAWGAEVRSYTLVDARDRDDVVSSLARDVVGVGLPDRVGSLVSVIADELLANALYVAPVDATGTRIRSAEQRDRSRALAGRDVVTVRWATDARYLAIEVRDRWGSIDLHAIPARLASGGKQATSAEGGMGLPLAFACCNQFVIGCAPGALTEVVALLDVRYKPTELGRTASFHAFTGTADEAAFVGGAS